MTRLQKLRLDFSALALYGDKFHMINARRRDEPCNRLGQLFDQRGTTLFKALSDRTSL